ncbi:MAG TPA: Smr/MutS family protein [Firmicutes bacterium]|nr:Smr/MutS family protein [Bacillota bacterium]
METIDLHGLTLEEAKEKLEKRLLSADKYGARVVRIIHGQGKHSEFFPVIKSFVRRWLEESVFAQERIESVFRGEDGSPYTSVNPGETIVVLKGAGGPIHEQKVDWEEEEEREARRRARRVQADKRRASGRRRPRY